MPQRALPRPSLLSPRAPPSGRAGALPTPVSQQGPGFPGACPSRRGSLLLRLASEADSLLALDEALVRRQPLTWAANGDLSLVLGWRRPGSSLGSGPPPASGTGTSLATQPAVSMRNESHARPAFRLDGADALILVQLQAKSGTAAFFTESRLSWLPSGRLYVREGSRLLPQA